MFARVVDASQLREILDQDEKRAENTAHPMAQAMDLRLRYAAYHAAPLVTVGQLCRQKEGFRYLKGDPVLMLWRMLDPSNLADWEIIEAAVTKMLPIRYDCVVGTLDGEGDILFVPADSRMLIPYTEDDDQPSEPAKAE